MSSLSKRILLYLGLAAVSAGLILCAAKTVNDTKIHPDISEKNEIDGKNQSGADDSETPDDTKENENVPERTRTAKEYLAEASFSPVSEEYTLSDGVYDDTYRLSLVTPTDKTFFDKAKYAVTYENEDGTTSTSYYFTMWPRMGFIIAADENGRAALNAKGETIVFPENYSMVFLGIRDAQNRPIFKEWRSDTLFAVAQDGSLTETTYDERLDFRGVNFDYPSYYGVSDDAECEVVSTRSGFGYRVHEGKSVPAAYEKAFAFSEGYGCACDAQNRLYFYNADGRLRVGGLASILYGAGEETGERALGYYYFDEGLTRAVRRRYVRGELQSEYETFVNRKGEEFRVPADYTVYSYSCGRILLEKNGLAGYMTSRGKFICEPTFTYARPFFEGLAVVGEEGGKKGMIDRDGKYVIEPLFDEITDCSGGVICLYDKSCGWQIINKTHAVQAESEDTETEIATQTEQNEN